MTRDDPSNHQIRCRCGAAWMGPVRAHCGSPDCHRTFDDAELFDAHRRRGRCTDPAELGLTGKGGIWQRPDPALTAGAAAHRARASSRRAS